MKIVPGLLLGLITIGLGIWILALRPDPPIGAKTATRRFRQMVAVISIIYGIGYIMLILGAFD